MRKKFLAALAALSLCVCAAGCGRIGEKDAGTALADGSSAAMEDSEESGEISSAAMEDSEESEEISSANESETESAAEVPETVSSADSIGEPEREEESTAETETVAEPVTEDIADGTPAKGVSAQGGIYIAPENIKLSYRENVEHKPTLAECEELLGRAIDQYQAAVSGDMSAYLDVESYRPLMYKVQELCMASGEEGGKYMEMTKQVPKHDIVINAYDAAWIYCDPSLTGKALDIWGIDPQGVASVLNEALDSIEPSACEPDDYFTRAAELNPIEAGDGLTCELLVKSCERFGDELYINFTASVYNGERTCRLANVFGWDIDGVCGTYIKYS